MRRAFLPILAVALVLLTGSWGFHVFVGFGRPDRHEGEEVPLVGVARPLPNSSADGDGRAGGGPRTPAGDAETPVSDPGERGTTTRAALTGAPAIPEPPPEAEPPRPDPDAAPRAARTTAAGNWRMVSNSGYGQEDDEALVPRGIAWIGTPQRWIDRAIADLGGPRRSAGLEFEAPRHDVTRPEGVYLERYEVTEERYRTFLEQTALVEFTTPLGDATTLVETAEALVTTRRTPYELEIAARQLYRGNRAVLDVALTGSVTDDGASDTDAEERRWEDIRDRRLPRSLALRFYDRAPPYYWPGDRYPAGRAEHPVRDLSLDDATALAIWAGKHLPSEVTWEYAARGPQGWDYPWGANGARFSDLVNGGVFPLRGEEADTVPVRQLPDGASWVGCLHMLGNVAEWTRTWPYPYPGAPGIPSGIGTPRGGSAANVDRLWIRPAYRGYQYDYDHGEAPHPRRAWMGARLARFREPARSRVACMQTRARLAPGVIRLDPAILEPRVYAGVEGRLESRILKPRQDASVRVGTKAFVVQPLAVVPSASDGPDDAWVFAPGVGDNVTALQALTGISEARPVLLGLFHNDIRLVDTYEALGPHASGSGRLRLRAAPTPPGSWWLCLYQGYLSLWAPQHSGEDSWRFLTRAPVSTGTVSLLKRRGRHDRPPLPKASLALDRSGALKCEVETWLGNAARPDLVVRVRFRALAEASVVEAVLAWYAGRLRD